MNSVQRVTRPLIGGELGLPGSSDPSKKESTRQTSNAAVVGASDCWWVYARKTGYPCVGDGDMASLGMFRRGWVANKRFAPLYGHTRDHLGHMVVCFGTLGGRGSEHSFAARCCPMPRGGQRLLVQFLRRHCRWF